MDIQKHHANFSIVLNWYLTKFSRDFCLPSLPAIAIALNTPTHLVKYIVSLYFLGIGLSRFFFTPLSDIFGRRTVILYSLPIFIIGSALCAGAFDFTLLVIGRCLQAFGIGCISAIGWAMIGDVYGEEGSTKAFAYLSTFAMWAPAFATAIGGHLQAWFGWRASFIVLTVGGALLYTQTLWGLRETNGMLQPKEKIIRQIWKNYSVLVIQPEYWRYILTFSLTFSGTVVYYSTAPFLFINTLHIPAHVYGYFAFATVAGLVIGKFLAVRTARLYDVDKTLMLGLTISALSGAIMVILALTFPPSVVTILGPSFLYFMGNGVMSPTAKAGTVSLIPGTAGTAAALFGLMQGLIAFLAGVASTFFKNSSGLGMGCLFCAISVLAILSMIVFTRAIPENKV